jgi:hypothetical protein
MKRLVVPVVCTFAVLLASLPTEAATTKALRGHVPPASSSLRPIDRLDPSTNLDLVLGLPLRNREELTNLIEQLYDPASPHFHQYLSGEEFTRRFAPTEADYQAAIDFARASGFKIAGTHPNRMLLDVRGSVGEIEKAFRTNLRLYRHPHENRNFYAPDLEPSVPAELSIQDISGLDNFVPPHPMDLRLGAPPSRQRRPANPSIKHLSNVKTASSPRPSPPSSFVKSTTEDKEEEREAPDAGLKPSDVEIIANATGSGPGGDFMGNDFRAAYAPGVTNDGAGQVIGLFEFGPYYTNDIYIYETNAGLSTSIVITNVLLNGVSGIPVGTNADDGEEALDIDMVISMAPGAVVVVYEGNNGNDMFNRMATDNLAKQMSCSFGFTPMPVSTEQIFQQYAAQGQSMFVSSGDGGAYPSNPGSIWPQTEDPYLTIVGGTSLTTSGAGGPWLSETTWGGSGGGVSTRWGIPSWQTGINMQNNLGSTTFRNIPDVSMLADVVIFWVYKNGVTGTVGGTSAAAPLWAGFTALVNQEAAKRGKPPVGFINPAVYAIGKGPSGTYNSAFHDITTGNNHKFPAVTGYDLSTGWGTPSGSNTINALVGTGTNDFAVYMLPGLPAMVPGGTAKSTVSVLPIDGAIGTVNFSVSGLPSGVSATFNPASTATTTLLTVTASNTAAAGTYALNVTATAGGLTHTVPFSLTILSPVPGATSVSLSSYFNRSGMYNDGSSFAGGADGGGRAYSATMLGSAPTWNGILFSLGPANAADMISSAGQTITLPAGQYPTLQMLAVAVNGNQVNQNFTVTYTDNSSTVFTQNISDWANPHYYSGEAIAVTTPYRNNNNGTADTGTPAYAFGYTFPLNPAKTIRNITLPVNANVEVLAITLANAAMPLPLASFYNRIGIYSDGTTFTNTSGLDAGGAAYSSAWLGGYQSWSNTAFQFGPVNASNAVSCAGQVIPVPVGNYLAIRMLATAINGNQTSQGMVINYTDSTTSTFFQNFSDWFTPQNYVGESKAVIMGYRNTSGGGKDNRTFYLYGYSIPVNRAKVVQSLQLPVNSKLEVLAVSLVPNWAPAFTTNSFTVPGITAGQPYSGSIAGTASDPNGDALTYGKVSGPSWLAVAGNGALSGTPLSPDAGTNIFTVSATDPGGLSASASMRLVVTPAAPITLSASLQDTNLSLSWAGGIPPYQAQSATDLANPSWQSFGGPINGNTVLVPRTNDSAFYRILGQ